VDEVESHQAASQPETAELLVLGSSRKRGGPAIRRVVLTGLAVLVVVAGIGAWQWMQSVDPTFTTDEIAATYRSLPALAGPVAWNTSTVSVDDAADVDRPPLKGVPAPCEEIYSPRLPPVSVGRVSIELAPAARLERARRWSGSAVTFRFPSSRQAREKFRLINDAFRRCREVGTRDTSIQILDLTAGSDTWSRSATRARVGLAWSRYDLVVDLVRFGNTVTWVVQGDGSGLTEVDSVVDVLIGRLEAGHR